MTIIGPRDVTGTKASGEFYCPRCDEDRAYRHQRVRRCFSVFSIPLIPLSTVGEYVECGHCETSFELKVLAFDRENEKSEVEAEYERAIKRVMVMMLLADDVVDPSEVEIVQDVFARVSGRDLTKAAVLDEIEAARESGLTIEAYAKGLAGALNDSGKEMVIRAAFMVAVADDEFQREELEMLGKLATALQMTPSQLEAVLETMTGDA